VIEANSTWKLVDAPVNQQPIGLKWVFKTKKDVDGVVAKYKAHLVAKGYVQHLGVDFEEVFTPVARLETVNVLLVYAMNKGWPIHHMGMKSAFLNNDLLEEVFISQPPGFIIKGGEQKVLRLIKALCGLRQVPVAWYAKLDASLVELGFQRGEAKHAMYTRGWGDRQLIVGVYVDDLIIIGGSNSKIKQFKQQMQEKF
jgi:hypothetical protein